MKNVIIILILLVFTLPVLGQRHLEKEFLEFQNPNEIVTLAESITFDKAIEVLSKVSEKNTGKNIVSTVSIEEPISIKIEKMQYYKAMLLIVKYFNLKFEEKEDVIIIGKIDDQANMPASDTYAPVTEREVKISAVIFEADVVQLNQEGINWNLVLGGNGTSITSELGSFTEIGAESETQTDAAQQADLFDYSLGVKNEFQVGDWTGSIEAMFRFFESNNWGEVISRPNVTVRNNQKGRIQIGSDLSIKQRDFAGNVVDNFISTGSIIEVTPRIFRQEGIDYVLLDLLVERSSGTPGEISTEIKKIEAATQVLMLDGEETVIGGLYINQENEVRRGIPLLKDLPWWVFGIRYLTGYTETQITKKEVIILLETNIMPTLKERIAIKKENLIQQQLLDDEKKANEYKMKNLIEELQKIDKNDKEGEND